MTTDYVVEKNVPIPTARRRKSKYPWATLEIGDSFYIDGPEGMRNSVQRAAILKGMRVTTRKDGTGIRVWRIE